MYDFDKVIERKGTNSSKYELNHQDDKDLIPMWVADMDFETLPEIKEALIKRAEHGIFGYAMVTDAYYETVIAWMKRRHRFDIEQDWIVTTPGVVTALKVSVRAFTKKNDAVMIMKPVYYPFDFSIELNQRKIVECPLDYDGNEYTCNFELFERNIIENNVKMFVLCNPHNPIGKVWSYEELLQIGQLCKKHHVIVISDEIHMDFIYQGCQHIPFYNVDESFKEFTVICSAPSKTFNLAALHTSNIIIANKELRELFVAEKLASGIGDPNIFGLDACQAAYTFGDKWVDELIDYLQGNIDFMIKFFNERLPKVKVVKPQGLYLIWVDMRALGLNKDELEELMLKSAHLYLDEGYIFGTGGEGFERFNVACPRSVLEKALLQLENALNK